MKRNFIKDSPLVKTLAALSAIAAGGWPVALILSRPAAPDADTRQATSLDADLAHTPHR